MILWRLSNAKAFTKVPFFNQERKLGERRRLDTVVVPTVNNITSGYVTLIFFSYVAMHRSRNQRVQIPGGVQSQV